MWQNISQPCNNYVFEVINWYKTPYNLIGDNKIGPSFCIRCIMVTLGVDFDCFWLGKPLQKQSKSNPRVTTQLLIYKEGGILWWIKTYWIHSSLYKKQLTKCLRSEYVFIACDVKALPLTSKNKMAKDLLKLTKHPW